MSHAPVCPSASAVGTGTGRAAPQACTVLRARTSTEHRRASEQEHARANAAHTRAVHTQRHVMQTCNGEAAHAPRAPRAAGVPGPSRRADYTDTPASQGLHGGGTQESTQCPGTCRRPARAARDHSVLHTARRLHTVSPSTRSPRPVHLTAGLCLRSAQAPTQNTNHEQTRTPYTGKGRRGRGRRAV
jgi:hypothetical protein